MPGSFYTIVHLPFESFTARRDARVRLCHAQATILRRKLAGNRVILRPGDPAELLRIGGELGHRVNDILGIVTAQTYRCWLREREHGRPTRPVGCPRLGTDAREIVHRLTRANLGWGYCRILGELRKLSIPIGQSSIRCILSGKGVSPPGRSRSRLHVETPRRKFNAPSAARRDDGIC